MNDLSTYRAFAPQMRPGDVIAFSGVALISYLIDLFAGTNVSHVAMVRQGMHEGRDVTITESTIEKGVSGPQTHPLGDVLANYGDGARAWWLPLSEETRALIDWQKFYAFIGASEGSVHYDKPGLVGFLARSIPVLGPRIFQRENARLMFCSGYDTATLEHCGPLRGINWSKTSPQDFIEMKLYAKCVQIMGKPAQLRNFNSI